MDALLLEIDEARNGGLDLVGIGTSLELEQDRVDERHGRRSWCSGGGECG